MPTAGNSRSTCFSMRSVTKAPSERLRCRAVAGAPARRRRSAAAHYALATAALVLALLSKPAAVAVPLVVVVLDVGLRRRPLRRALPGLAVWLVLAAGCVVLTKWQQPDRLMAFVPPIWARLPLADAGKAHALLESGKVLGKIILKP